MANANISTIAVTNTFDEWRTRTNDLIVDRNLLRNHPYVKDNSDFTIANGALTISRSGGGTLLTITTGDALIGGTITTSDLIVGDDASVANLLTVLGNTVISGNVSVSRNIAITQNANVSGTLNVVSRLDVANNTFIYGDAFVGGKINVVSTAEISGNTTLYSNVEISKNLTLFQNTTIAGTANISGDVFISSGLTAVGNTTLFLNLTTSGNAVLQSNLSVSSNAVISQNANVSGTLNVGSRFEAAGNTSLYSNVAISGNLTVAQNVSTTGTLNVTETTSLGLLNVSGNTTISANANIAGNLTVSSNLSAYNIRNDSTGNYYMDRGNASFNNMTVTGNLALSQPAITTSDRIILNELPTLARDGYFIVRRGAANSNATIRFSESLGVWRAGGSDTVSTILLASNLENSVSSTSTINVAVPAAVKLAFDTAAGAFAQANTARTQANNAYGQANLAYTQANSAYGQANSAFTAANNRVSSVSGTSGRITSSGGLTPTIDLATAGAGAASYSSGISAISVDAYGRVTSVSGSAAYITTDGRAYPRRSDGTNINFQYSGNSGQPTWLWGTNDGVTMQVWNPSNFSVSYASSAGNADTVDGYHASAFALLSGATFTGNIFAPAFFYSSDRKLKENIKTIDNALNIVNNLRGVSYNFISDQTKTKQIGVIAQEVKQFLPEVVTKGDNDIHSVSYGNMVGVLIEAIKELNGELVAVKSELTALKASIGK